MMGYGHAVSGAAVGAAVFAYASPANLDVGGPAGTVALMAVAAGCALLPDIDHPTATASNTFGPVTRVINRAVVGVSRGWYQVTRSRWDQELAGGHRKLTHTLLFAALAGMLTMVCAWWQPTVTGAVLIAWSLATLARLFSRWQPYLIGPVTLTLGVLFPPHVEPWQYGAAVAIGCVTHCLGDFLTRAGVPLFAPFLPIMGHRWWDVRLPRWLSFRAGGRVENVLVVGLAFVAVYCAAKITGAL